MSFTTSERVIIDEVAHQAARAAVRDVLVDIQRVVAAALREADRGNTQVLELLEGLANAQVSAAGSMASTLKSEIAAARKKNGKVENGKADG